MPYLPLTAEQKAKKRERDKAREQSPEGKARAAARYRRKKELAAIRPRPPLCEACGGTPDGKGTLHWDHEHPTGTFRGWLCSSCNAALGYVSDDPERLRKLADYLETWRLPYEEGAVVEQPRLL